jgi:hypothetical protein
MTMKANRLVAAMLAASAIGLPLSAQACEVTRTPWGLRVSNCALKDLYRIPYDAVLDVAVNPPILHLPNLVVTDVDARTFGGVEAEITVDMLNNGTRNAGGFDVIVLTTVHNIAGGAQVSMTPLGPASIAGLAVGAIASQYMGVVVLPNRTQDWDVCSIAIVDPAVNGPPPWGRVFESNESDNEWSAACTRVFAGK